MLALFIASALDILQSMKTIAVISQKGGAGKTTIATSLATQGYLEGLKTLLVDLDPQGSSYKWGQRRDIDTPAVISAQAVGLEKILEGAQAQGVELVILDTAPHSEKDARLACQVADLALIPCRPSIHDLDAIEDTINIAQLAKTPAYVLLNAVHPNSPRQYEDVKTALEQAYEPLQMLAGFYLANRSEFVHSATDGLTANETDPEGKASQEIRTLFEMLDALVGIRPFP